MWRRQWPEGEVLLTLGHSRQDKMRLGRGSKNSPHNATKSRIRKTAVIEISDAFAALLNRHRGTVAPPPLPHHRTCGSAYGGSASCALAGRHKGFAALQISVSASPSSEPAKLSRS